MSSDYTIVDITDEAPRSAYNEALSVVLGEAPALDARADLKRSIADWSARHGFDLGLYDIVLGTDDDDDVRIVLPNLTIDSEGDVVTKRREYTVTAQYTVEVVVTIEAASEDEARDEADGELSSAVFDIEWVDGAEVSDTDYLGITDVDEV